jgi:hypothetical protein
MDRQSEKCDAASPLKRQKTTEPAFIEPMQCKPVTALPTDDKWTFEIKFRRLGEPIIEALDDGNVSVTVRRIRGTSWEVLVASRAQLLAATRN